MHARFARRRMVRTGKSTRYSADQAKKSSNATSASARAGNAWMSAMAIVKQKKDREGMQMLLSAMQRGQKLVGERVEVGTNFRRKAGKEDLRETQESFRGVGGGKAPPPAVPVD